MGRFRVSPWAIGLLLIGAAIAALQPFDPAFDAITVGVPAIRGASIILLGLIGAFLAQRAGLSIGWHGSRWPMLVCLIAAVGVSLYVVSVDALFRPVLPPHYVAVFHKAPLWMRLMYFMARAFNENILYRLFIFSGLVNILIFFQGWHSVQLPQILAAGFVAQALNLGINIMAAAEPITATLLVYDLFRIMGPGLLWAWLFWRFGFITSEVSHVGGHLVLQPMLGALLG
jgi:hypothetical protein